MNANLERVIKFLDKTQTYYLATVDKDQPHVRPFGTALVYNDKLYIQTGKIKKVSKQLAKNPKAEICAFDGNTWLRIEGKLVNDDNIEVKKLMLEKMPSLRYMYNENDGNMQMLYFEKATVFIDSFDKEREAFEI